jgi:hypothetical protein
MILSRYQYDLLPTLRNSPSAEQIRRLSDARLYSATLTYTTMAGILGMLVGGLAGAGAATIIYEIVEALAFATSHTDLPLSSSITTRGMAQMLVAILSAVGAVWALSQPSKSDASSSVHS